MPFAKSWRVLRRKQRGDMMLKVIMLLLGVVMFGAFAEDGVSQLTPSERTEFAKLNKKKPPKGKENDSKELKSNYQFQQNKLAQLNKDIDVLENTDIRLLDGDIKFIGSKIERLEKNRANSISRIAETRKSVNQFNQAVMDYVSEQLNKNGYIVFGVPAFPRSEKYSHPKDASKLLVVNMDYPAKSTMYAVGGEIVTAATGKAQFVVLHKSGHNAYSIEKTGKEIEITEDDKRTGMDSMDYYKKIVLFTDNFAELNKDDLWGIIIDADARLTYDKFASGSSYVTEYHDGDDSLKWSEDNVQGKNAFSFSLFVQTLDKE